MKIDPFGLGIQNWGPAHPWTWRNWLQLKICGLIYKGYRRLAYTITHWTESRFKVGDAIVTGDWAICHDENEIGIVTKTYGSEGYMVQFDGGEFWVPRHRIKGRLAKPTEAEKAGWLK